MLTAQDEAQQTPKAVTRDDFVIIGRTNAVRNTGLDDALRRAEAYKKAGSDILYVSGRKPEDLRFLGERLNSGGAGIEYLLPIFTNAIGSDDMEAVRQTLFNAGNLTRPYHSVNTDINKRICYLE